MKYLIIYAHPNNRSFNHAIKEAVQDNLKSSGKEFIMRDLYAIGFKPVLEAADFIALSQGKVLADVETEQRCIKDADKLIFIHPIWWFGMPAVLKGYIDRVFSKGFAYDYNDKGVVGLLSNKKALIFNTTGGAAADYEKNGFNSALKTTIDIGTFGLCGITVETHKFYYGIPTSTDEFRKNILNEIRDMKF